MRFRVSILDLTAAIIVFVVLILPQRSLTVSRAYAASDEATRDIALYQARLAADPGDVEAAETLAELLTEAKQTDWAVQVAGEAARHNEPMSWRALLAVSLAHADRIEVADAHRFAAQALEKCRQLGPATCPGDEEVRLSMYYFQLDAGVRSGIDPRHNPLGYQEAVFSSMRVVRVRGGGDQAPDKPERAPAPDGSGGEPPSQSAP